MKKNEDIAELFKKQSGFNDMEAEIIGTMAALFGDLLLSNWSTIKQIRQRSEDSAVTISIGFDVDSSGKLPLVKGKISFSEKWKDEAEMWVKDPNQPDLELN